MKQYNLGPNGGILTSLNLFATKIDQIINLLGKAGEATTRYYNGTTEALPNRHAWTDRSFRLVGVRQHFAGVIGILVSNGYSIHY